MNNSKVFGVLQRIGRSFMLPIAMLPVAGLLLGIGGSFTNETMLKTYGLWNVMGPGTIIHGVLEVMRSAGDIIFANLPVIFAIGVAIGMAKAEKATAALASAIAFFVMHASISSMITLNGGTEKLLEGSVASVIGIESLQMGVFGGIIVGLGVAALHNQFYKIELPNVLSFFGGTRFVPIISALVYVFVGILMFFIWPPVQSAINAVGSFVRSSGYGGTWVYGFMERLLIPFGLHHVFYLPFWQTAVGGTMEIGGRLVEGAQNIFFAQLADPSTSVFSVEATRFMSGKFPLMIFGLPGAALAMYHTAKKKNRKVVGGLLFSAALTSMLTGITEPLEFTFLFVAPFLYGIHCVFAGLAYMLMHILKVGVGMTFSGGFIDLLLFGIMQGNGKTHWLRVIPVGIAYFIVYYLVFSFIIKKRDLKTPGREDKKEEEIKLYTKEDMKEKSSVKGKEVDEISTLIMAGLGGRKNIRDVDSCATRLRCSVEDPNLVNKEMLTQSGAAGVIMSGNGVQVIYGPRVSVIKSNLEEYIENVDRGETEEVHLTKDTKVETPETQENKGSAKQDHQEIKVFSPMKGKVVPLKEVPDEAFAQEVLGRGIAVDPTEYRLYAPIQGTVAMVFDTKHAIGITSDDGLEILLHVGMDTVETKGEGFTVHVKQGDSIDIGDLLMEFDGNLLKEKGYPLVTPMIFTNLEDHQELKVRAKGNINAGDELLIID
ncbi:MAG: glucose PTS transporter subunit IIA [Tissierellia bacterium]|nr:glucose PTS transporter subunit IIA [Tissierellia bacterium]